MGKKTGGKKKNITECDLIFGYKYTPKKKKKKRKEYIGKGLGVQGI